MGILTEKKPSSQKPNQNSFRENILDQFSRPLHDLRISVIDRCNFRCTYCMPAEEFHEKYTFLSRAEWLSFDETVRLVKQFVSLGVSKVRITGGEPLLREGIDQLISKLSAVSGIEDLALTTNGVLLTKHIRKLKAAGLKRLTVSLDTLDEDIFYSMNGQKGKVSEVLEGITAAEEQGFDSIKINVVVQKGINDGKILDIVKYFKGTGHIVRFIEYMDVGNKNNWQPGLVVPSKQILELINAKFPVEAVEPGYFGEVAERYRYRDGAGEIGFISSITQPFCGSCTRARLSTDGKFYTCLFAGAGHDLRTPLRNGSTDTQIVQLIQNIWQTRNDRYSEERFTIKPEVKQTRKIEMYQIGG